MMSDTSMKCLAPGNIVLLRRKGVWETALVESTPEGGWFRAITPDGKSKRFPVDLPLHGPVGKAPIPADSDARQTLLRSTAEKLAALATAIDIDTLHETALIDARPFTLDELGELLFPETATGPERGALALAITAEESPFEEREGRYVPLSAAEIAERRREREARTLESTKRVERRDSVRRAEKEHVLPELKLLLADRARPERLSAATRTWLSELRHNLIMEGSRYLNGGLTVAGETIRIRDEGHAVQLLFRAGLWDPDVEDVIAIRADIGRPFDEAVSHDAVRTTPRSVDAVDLTHLPTFTIDSESTEDLDDALSLVDAPSGIRVHIHIADVERWIPQGSALDEWGRWAGESVYLPECVHHLFPRAFMQQISLAPDVVRNAFTLSATITEDGDVVDAAFVRSRIRSDERLDYAEADRRFEADPTWRRWLDVQAALQRRREARGARVPLLPELVIVPGKDGIRTAVLPTNTPSHRFISELMIFYNEQIGLYFREKDVPAIFKTQPPAEETTEYPEENDPLYFPRIVRMLRPSVGGLEPKPHSFLGVEAYCQATSPIRRYQDLVHERQLAAVIAGDTPPYSRDDLAMLAPLLEERASEIKQVERRRRRYWLLRKLQTLRGQPVRGVVSQVRAGGRPVVFFPDYLLETPLIMPPDLQFDIGDELFVTPKKVDPIRGGIWAAPGG